jgi:hypothetical protein
LDFNGALGEVREAGGSLLDKVDHEALKRQKSCPKVRDGKEKNDFNFLTAKWI